MTSKTATKRQQAAERKQQIIQLRRDGHLLTEIGEKVGVSPQYCHRVIVNYLDKMNEEMRADAAQLQMLEHERLERMLKAVWPDAMAGKLSAIDRVIKILEREAKLLGLDAPTKVAPTSPDGSASYNLEGVGLAGLLADIKAKESVG